MDEIDLKIVEYFFTNVDKKVFFARNLHPEVWALFQARYSRSVEGVREGFINLLKEAPEEYENVRKIFSENKTPNIEMEHALNKAIKFMDKWVLGYGHSSVAEGACVGICVENVSILATKYVETSRLSSFIEKSTRYVKFTRDSFYKPIEITNSEFSEDYDKVVNLLFDTYEKLQEPVLEHVMKVTENNKETNEKAWVRACGARRFDAVRYILPAATMTSFGWTVNARELAHAIRKMNSHPLSEIKTIGNEMVVEGRKVLPSLLKYTEPLEYLSYTEKGLFINTETNSKYSNNEVKLLSAPSKEDFENVLACALIHKNSLLSYDESLNKIKNMNETEKLNLIKEAVKGMSSHDLPPREFENINLKWEIVMDYGGYRDLQRHRIMTQSEQLLTTFLGYEIPPDIENSGCLKDYIHAMQEADKLFRKMYEKMPYEAQYLVPLAFRKRILVEMNYRALHHFIRIRSSPHGHFSYRNIVQKMYLIMLEKYGKELMSSLECNFDNVDLGRLKGELKIESMKGVKDE